MKRIGSLIGLTALLSLSACTPSEDDVSGGSGHTEIRSVSVTGTDGQSSSGSSTVTIAPSQNGGIFTLSHDAESSTEPMRAEWYISSDASLSDDDKIILGRNCDQPFGDCQSESAKFTCRFTNDVKTVCADGVAGDTTQLSSYFAAHQGLPGTYTLIFRACDGLFSDCLTRKITAVFN